VSIDATKLFWLSRYFCCIRDEVGISFRLHSCTSPLPRENQNDTTLQRIVYSIYYSLGVRISTGNYLKYNNPPIFLTVVVPQAENFYDCYTMCFNMPNCTHSLCDCHQPMQSHHGNDIFSRSAKGRYFPPHRDSERVSGFLLSTSTTKLR
jgi:hypothetical protein